MRAIIGPNGAGKTTMMDVITGKTRPDEGDVYFEGRHDLTNLDEADIADLGIGRKFQKPTVFENHTVNDNILLAAKAPRSVFATLFGRAAAAGAARRSSAFSTTIRLGDVRERLAGVAVAWAEAMAGDRHAAGPGSQAVAGRRAGRRHDRRRDRRDRRAAERNRPHHSVVVVEHDMAFVRELGVKVTVLHEGSVLAEGSLDQVSADERVIEVYLGR